MEGWEELGGVEGGKTVIRKYYVKKKISIFNKRGKKVNCLKAILGQVSD